MVESVIVMGKRRNKFGSIGHKLPQVILNSEIPKRRRDRCVHQSAGIGFLEWERSGCVEWHIIGKMVVFSFFRVFEIISWDRRQYQKAKKKSAVHMLGQEEKSVQERREGRVRKPTVRNSKTVLIFFLNAEKWSGVEIKEYENPLNLTVINKVF